jgi:hypothetical protein
MIRTPVLALVLVGLLCGNLDGQDRNRSRDHDDPGPISTLLSLEAELGLTAVQVERLTSVDRRMDELNHPLVTRLNGIRKQIRTLGDREERRSPANLETYEAYLAVARPLMREIERNNRTAMEEVGEILTDAQKDEIGRRIRVRNEKSDRNNDSARSQDCHD